ncbi:restriction endonuclease subunit S [Segatella copri]|uniref:restriction endonuclease subunit S n=1 Tax=Segatella copri TaxID=165179 RepID=UPI001290BD21|nr:restriction endonuclease subunit S [Segatella copri]MQN75200.1 restriction endonuclease subunit S [Segatella copri]MQO26262.1 restriction endonuclease subunit S [Segatella copri]MQO44379.1 restriction endonuclease subunit S [Segatella copri]MQO51300.1 restriction endonuclease subunit S [Segatella copri]MQO86780.1 restriction endonuclease subunit S [Segatella copri]
MATYKEQNKLNVPHLRFPEFHGEWCVSTIGEQFDLYSGNTPSRLNKEHFEGNVNWITSGELKEHYISDTKEKISEDAATANNLKLLHPGTFVIAIYGLEADGVRGTGSITCKESTISQACMAFTQKGDVKNEFLYSWYKKHGNIIGIKYAQGTKQQNLSYDILEKFHIAYPSQDEQDKLIKFISLLDERIATQSKLIEDLKKLKSAISKLLFTRKDMLETTIRLADIATLKNGYAFQSSKYNILGKWKIITIANVSGGRYINEEDCNCIINLPNDIQDHQVLKEGDILISLTGNVGRVSLCKSGAYLLNQRVGLLHIEGNIDKEFLYQVLSSRRFENNMVACGQGAAQMNIGKGDVENFVLPYSSKANNIHLVARILHSYDECIINELRELTLLTMQKQYFLAQMFI